MKVNTPPMGWNTWNTFGDKINEELIRQTADVMVSSGLKDAGYEYLVIDDCWSLKERDAEGRLQADPEKFPSGMKAVADYVHSKGLKFGMYSCCGTLTCGQYPASYEHETVDAETFASWGVDFLKYDHCFKPQNEPSDMLYRKMGMALANSGRDILFSACSWGVNETHKWIKSTDADMWRSTGDIFDKWESVKQIYEQNKALQPYNGRGCFNDMDMLIVGMNGKGNVGLGGCTETEYRTHFSIWAMFASPLMIGCDIRSMDDATKNILMNKDVIAINQDENARQPYEIGSDLWVRLLANGDLAIMFVNAGDTARHMAISLRDVGLTRASHKTLKLTDMWSKEEFDMPNEIKVFNLEPHECKLLRGKIVDE